jgi:hypothetical protein
MISRIGCNGDSYYWFIKLTVTDAAGLSTIDSSKIFPLCGGPLPITLESFNVTVQGKTNKLNWITSAEINLSYFEVERSYDGYHFESLGRVNALRAPGLGNYELNDAEHPGGYTYYRLKMVDIGDRFTYSMIVRVLSGTTTDNKLTVTPNPVRNEFVLSGSFTQPGKVMIKIVDMNESVVKIVNVQAAAGYNRFKISQLEGFGKGVYTIEVIQDNDTRKTKLMKAN